MVVRNGSKQFMMTVPMVLFEKVLEEKEKFGYGSVQDVVNEVLRERFLRVSGLGKSKVGRPRKLDETLAVTRKGPIFSRDGVAVEG